MQHGTGNTVVMSRFRRLDNSFGWLAFVIAAVTYCVTAESSASYWDCSEFIFSAHNLEVNHPPGAPFFMLTANFFSVFAAPDEVAYMVNIMSALLSAGCILFLFWSITHLTRRLIIGKEQAMTTSQAVTILASGMVGALAYTWSDTFWFSAVEAEVYGFSSLFTAVTFWLILKWEEDDCSPASDRWLILIAYLTGLSIGVHLLNLLCLPAVALVAYYKKRPDANWKGALLALVLSGMLVVVVLYGIMPGMLKMGSWAELLFVNVFGLPFHTGLCTYMILLFATFIVGLVLTVKGCRLSVMALLFTFMIALLGIPFYGYNLIVILLGGTLFLVGVYFAARKFMTTLRVYHTTILCVLMIVVGYSSYALILIRSNANTPMAQCVADDIFSLTSYINREQYGSSPLLYGPGFDSEFKVDEETGKNEFAETTPVYMRVGDRYEFRGYNKEHLYEQNMFFPRMYNSAYAGAYESWIGGEVTNTVKAKHPEKRAGRKNPDEVKMPTQWDNAKFFLFYQVGYMYMRYLAWNFIGRQNDVQFLGGLEHGNCITGISFIDNLVYGDQDKLPSNLKDNNAGRNVYFGIPFILGILGLVWQYRRGRNGKNQFWVTFTLFLMTGLAIVVYLNQTPSQARARDYSFAASFYAFAIWIGMGVAAIVHLVSKKLRNATEKKKVVASCVVSAVCLLVPLQMLSQTWDDHDRSGRYACRDFARNILDSMQDEGNPIIFTSYDNDTYPLWYCQAVEGIRTDARVCFSAFVGYNESLDQMKSPAYDSPPVPTTWQKEYYRYNSGGSITVLPEEATPVILEYVADRPQTRALLGNNPLEINSVTRYWVQESSDDEKSAARVEVEMLFDHLRTKGAKIYNDSVAVLSSRIADMKMRLENADDTVGNALSDSIEYYMEKCDDLTSAASRMQDIGQRCIPAELHIPVDSAAVCESGMMMPCGAAIPEYMVIEFKGKKSIEQFKLVMLDIIASAGWRRPVYMSSTILAGDYHTYLKRFFVQEGLALRVTPFDWSKHGYKIDEINRGFYPMDIDKAYRNVMTRFKWGGIKEKENYYADEVVREFTTYHHDFIAKLASAMYRDIEQAESEGRDSRGQAMRLVALLEKQQMELPTDRIPLNVADRKWMIVEVCKNLYVRESALKGKDGYLGDDVCERILQLYKNNLKDVARFGWEYVKWYEVCKLKFVYDEEEYKKILYNALRVFYEGEAAGIKVHPSEVLPCGASDIAGLLKKDLSDLTSDQEYATRLKFLEFGMPKAVMGLLASTASKPEFAALHGKYVAELLGIHCDMLKKLYREYELVCMDSGDTRRKLWLMERVLECVEYELCVMRQAGIAQEQEHMAVYRKCADVCGYVFR